MGVGFVRTDAEVSAGIIPVDYAYAPGDVRRYGAVLDGTTSDDGAFVSANSQADAGGSPIFIPRSANGMATDVQLVVDADVDLVFERGACIVYTGSADISILVIGDYDVVTTQRRYTGIRVVRQNQSDWTDESNIAVRLVNISRSFVEVLEAANCTIGVQCLGQSNAFAINRIELGLLINNKYGLDINNDDDAGVGYTNSNSFRGGYFTCDTGVNSSLDRYGIRIHSASSTPYQNNDNKFHDLTFELNTAGSGQALSVFISHGVQNEFYGCRDELNDAPFMTCTGDSEDNIAYVTYGSSAVANNGNYFNNFVFMNRSFALQRYTSARTYSCIQLRANEYSATSDAYFWGLSVMTSTSGNQLRAATGFSFNDNYVDYASTRAVGFMLDVRNCRRFIVSRDVESATGGRWLFACYNSSKTQLTSSGGAHPYAVSTSGTSLQYDTNFGGCYQTGGDGSNDLFVAFKSDVAFAWVGVAGGTSHARLRALSVQSIDGSAINTFQGFTDGSVRFFNDDRPYATGAPANNIGITYVDGLRIDRADGVPSGAPGWKCTTAGVGGTAVFKIEAAVAS
jgi:hypothetical protein